MTYKTSKLGQHIGACRITGLCVAVICATLINTHTAFYCSYY